jgi:O-antigen/teichoic acid export membrane protein
MAVLIHGKIGGKEQSPEPNHRLAMPGTEWVWKLLLIAIAYVVIYFSFGSFVFMPLAGEAYQSYYGDLRPVAWLPLLQVVRGITWAVLVLPVIRMMKGRWWEICLAVALLFSVLMGFLLLLPNPIMPDAIRRAHFVEVTSSNFLFGWIVAWVLHRRHGSVRNLFRRPERLSRREATL